jgi:hypothetical protein
MPSPALLIAIVALVVAMGGTSYAAFHLGKNTVGSSQLKHDAVRSSKVADGSLLARDFKAGQLPQAKQPAAGPQGPQGAQGQPGEQGAAGPAGPAGPTQGAAAGFINPPALAKTVNAPEQVTITTKTAGSLFVTANMSTALSGCPGQDDCVAHFGLYVDGNPLPGTKTEAGFGAHSARTYQNVSVVGIAPNVPAGTHTVALRLIDLPVGATEFDEDFSTIGAVLLGG